MFLNEEKKPFKDLSGEEMKMVVDGLENENLEVLEFNGRWIKKNSDGGCIYLDSIYRVPPRKTKIDWSFINPKLKYFAIDKSGAEMFYSEKPTLSVGAWECNPNSKAHYGFLLSDKVIQIGDEPWQESLIERPKGE